MNIFASVNWFFFYPLNSLNLVRICAGALYSAPRNLQKQDRVITRFSCYSTKKWTLYDFSPNPVNSRFSGYFCVRCRTANAGLCLKLVFQNNLLSQNLSFLSITFSLATDKLIHDHVDINIILIRIIRDLQYSWILTYKELVVPIVLRGKAGTVV